MSRTIVYHILDERARQTVCGYDADDTTRTANDWVAYIAAYVGKCSDAHTNKEHDFRDNMIKVAALAVAAIEAYDKAWR